MGEENIETSPEKRVKAVTAIADMNEELKQWVTEAKKDGSLPQKIKNASEKEKQTSLGKCQICSDNEAKYVCVKCEQSVCSSHFFHLVGLCEKCLSRSTVEKWKNLRPDWEKVLGVEWID